jgi:hypothetical protein
MSMGSYENFKLDVYRSKYSRDMELCREYLNHTPCK